MNRLLDSKYIAFSLAGLTATVIFLLIIMPAEKDLGGVIKLVFLHGALVQTGLLGFAAAGILGLYYLIRKKESICSWCLAVQKTSVILWILYSLSSMVVTYMAWGVAVAWDEPRVRASVNILIVSMAFLILTLWVHHKIFTAMINIIMALLAWFLVKRAVIVQHPFDPIGTSDSAAFKIYFILVFVIVILAAVQSVRWLYHKDKKLIKDKI